MQGSRNALDRLRSFIEGEGFPAFALGILLFYELLLLALFFTPGGETGFGAIAGEFRIWCSGYDPATGRVDPAYVAGMTVPPGLLGGILALLWFEPLRGAFRRPVLLVAPVAAAALVVGGAAAGLGLLVGEPENGELPFPAEAIRTAHRAPELSLINQERERVDLAELRGKVVLLTAIYASCPSGCPMTLAKAKSAIGALESEEREDLRVVAVTLDPEYDSPEVLAELARGHGFETPLYNLVGGPSNEVEPVLDAMGIARKRDPTTGVIEHASMFLLLDRDGKLAYRLGLGTQQSDWLLSALRTLLREGPDVG
jgi:protein SCO1/2